MIHCDGKAFCDSKLRYGLKFPPQVKLGLGFRHAFGVWDLECAWHSTRLGDYSAFAFAAKEEEDSIYIDNFVSVCHYLMSLPGQIMFSDGRVFAEKTAA